MANGHTTMRLPAHLTPQPSTPTPGPWRVGRTGGAVVADVPAGHPTDDEHVAYYGGHLVAESICASNRPLIAAAPTMLAKLKALATECAHCLGDGCAECEDIYLVIAQAEGRAA